MEKILYLKNLLSEKKYYILGILIFVVLLGGSYFFSQNMINKEKSVILAENIDISLEQETESEICYVKVDIKGEVKVPGLYQIACDSRVQDVIDSAGGLTANSDTSILNLGKKVKDEMVIVVYSKEETNNLISTKIDENEKIDSWINQAEIKNDGCIEKENLMDTIIDYDNTSTNEPIGDTPVKILISINNATKEELMTLPGIGESKANNIINYRNEYGKFNSLEEIKNVNGIGESVFAKIKDDITL